MFLESGIMYLYRIQWQWHFVSLVMNLYRTAEKCRVSKDLYEDLYDMLSEKNL